MRNVFDEINYWFQDEYSPWPADEQKMYEHSETADRIRLFIHASPKCEQI